MSKLNHLPDHARVWIYQASRILSPEEQAQIRSVLNAFVQGWQAHGTDLAAGYEIRFDRFVILAVDESVQPATGCSIDKSVHLILELEKAFDLSFTNRQLIAYRSGEEVTVSPMHEFWALRKAERISGETIVFDNLVKNLAEYRSAWEKPFAESWHQTMWH